MQEIEAVITQLADTADRLDATNTRAEDDFVAVGTRLQDLLAAAQTLATHTGEAVRLMGRDSEGSALNRIDRTAQASLAELRQQHGHVVRCLDDVSTLVAHLGRLSLEFPVIKKAARRMRMIALSFAIESSRSAVATETFRGFVADMRAMAVRMRTLANRLAGTTELAAHDQRATLIDNHPACQRLGDMTAQAQCEVDDALARLDQIVSSAVEALQRTAAHSRRISELVGTVVMSIQFRDITRQQTEHVVAALAQARELCATAVHAGDPTVAEQALARAHGVLCLQAAQLQQVIATIGQAHGTILEALENLSREGELLVDGATSIIHSDCQDVGGVQTTDALVAGLSRLEVLLRDGQALGRQIQEAAVRASGSAAQLRDLLEEIADLGATMNLQALNAISKSARLGNEGRSLQVISQEVTGLSLESDDFVCRVVEQLEGISDLAQRMQRADLCAGALQGAGTEHAAAEDLAVCAHDFRGACVSFREHAASASRSSRTIRTGVEAAVPMLGFLPELGEALSGHLERIESLVEALHPWADGSGLAAEADLARHARSYTMKSERDIHAQLAARTAGRSVAPDDRSEPREVPALAGVAATRNDAADDTDDLGDNVELF